MRRILHTGRGAVAALLGIAAIIVAMTALGAGPPGFVVVLGALIGISYGLLGVCLTLIFRVSGIINFALPAIGLFAMGVMPMLIKILGAPWWVAFVAVLPVGFATGALIDALVFRRLAAAPRVVGVVASLGGAGVLAAATSYTVGLTSDVAGPLGSPPGLPSVRLDALLIHPGYVGLIISAPLLTSALTLFLTRSRFGLAVRASASNPDNAKLSGISPALVSAVAGGIAGLISTVTTVFYLGNVPADPTSTVFSTATLLPALGAAAIGSFRSMPTALVGGVAIGVVQQVMLWQPATAPYADLAIFAILALALLASPRQLRARGDALGSWLAVATWRPLPARLERIWLIRNIGRITLGVVAVGFVVVALGSNLSASLWTVTLCVVILSITAVLITGLAGELSLGQFGIALLGGGVCFMIVRVTGNFALGLGAAALTGSVALALIAYPSLRARGLALPILSLAIAIAVPTAFLADPAVMGRGIATPQQPVLGTFVVGTGIPYFLFALAISSLCAALAWNVWRGGFGRRVRAARDNELAAAAFGIRVVRTRLVLLAIAAAISGVAGALLIHSYVTVTAASLPTDLNIRVVLAVVMGGVSVLYGAPLAVLWLSGSAVAQTATQAGVGSGAAASLAIYSSALVLILVSPGGAAQLLQPVRDLVAVGLGRLFGVRATMAQLRGERRLSDTVDEKPTPDDGRTPAAQVTPTPGARALPSLREVTYSPAPSAEPILAARDLRLDYGAVTAVDGLSIDVHPGKVLGLIGPNGAGKTTTFELISGFATPTSGTVHLAGEDITALSPDRRVGRGLVRSFQDAQLFPTMTTLEVVRLALERQQPTPFVGSLLGVDLTAKNRSRVAEEIIDFFGLTRYRSSRIRELSTGSRRFVELASLISMRPRVLLLDEPSSGIAQRESEALAPLLLRLREQFDLTMLIIEHDIPLIMKLSDRILAMDQGRCLRLGAPDEVRADQAVIDAYLGTATAVIERSDQQG